MQSALERYGESISIMVVGETGVGKTTLLSNLFHRPVEWDVKPGGRTRGIHTRTLRLRLGDATGEGSGVPFEAVLTDSPGWGDLLSLVASFKVVTKHLDALYARALRDETKIARTVRSRHDERRVGVHSHVAHLIFRPLFTGS